MSSFLPNMGGVASSNESASPPPTVPGLTQPQTPAPQDLIKALMRKPEQAGQLTKQAILLLQQAADLDPRQEPRISAALSLLRGPRRPDTET